MKGIVPLIAGFVLVTIFVEAIYLSVFVSRTEITTRVLVEKEIFSAINKMEFVKREIPVAMQYSFDQAAYDLANRGGYMATETSYNCIAYWKVFSQDYTPDFATNINNNFLKIFSKYTSAMSDSTLTFPNFKPTVDIDSNSITISAASNIIVENPDIYTVKNNPTFSINVDPTIFTMFGIGKEFVQTESEQVSSASSYSDALQKTISIQDQLNSKYQNQFTIVAQPENNLGTSDNTFAFRTLVTIIDNSNKKYPVYDFSQNKNDYKALQLSFYIIDGKDSSITPQTSFCQEIKY